VNHLVPACILEFLFIRCKFYTLDFLSQPEIGSQISFDCRIILLLVCVLFKCVF